MGGVCRLEKSANNSKRRLLALAEFFKKRTDEEHAFSAGEICDYLAEQGIAIGDVLRRNDAYHALAAADGLIFTGPTGTNVNDITVLLVRR